MHRHYLLFFTLAMAGCDTFYTVHGTVTDCSDGSPIAGADVQLEMHVDGQVKHDETKSEADGSFIAVLNEPKVSLQSLAALSVPLVSDEIEQLTFHA